jgi:hypothetical protein
MKKWAAYLLIISGTVLSITGSAATCVASDTHTITATSDLTWKSAQGESTAAGAPLVETVKVGDIVEFTVPDNLDPPIPHGVVTISGEATATPGPTPAPDLVQPCGQSNSAAVLREIDCTGTPNDFFGNRDGFVGTLKLEVTDKFKADTNFWCTVHKRKMWGKLKL